MVLFLWRNLWKEEKSFSQWNVIVFWTFLLLKNGNVIAVPHLQKKNPKSHDLILLSTVNKKSVNYWIERR